jgi:hypothetical protein
MFEMSKTFHIINKQNKPTNFLNLMIQLPGQRRSFKLTDRRCDTVLPSQGYLTRHKQQIYSEVLQPIIGVTNIFLGVGSQFSKGAARNVIYKLMFKLFITLPFKDIRVIFKIVFLHFYANISHMSFFLQFPVRFKNSSRAYARFVPAPASILLRA